MIFCCIEYNPALSAALIGSAITGVLLIISNIINGFFAKKRDDKSFERTKAKEQLDNVKAAYEDALGILIDQKNNDEKPGRGNNGTITAYLSLVGSREVIALFNGIFQSQSFRDRKFDLEPLIKEMKNHLQVLEDNI